jgi:aminopeptidase 2
MSWWDELWLNEGFATFVGWLAVDRIHPEWNVFTSFVSRDYQFGSKLDSQRSSHPIQVEVEKAQDIDQIFDGISYNKGAAVIRMLENHLGKENFANGVNQYLKKHAFGNATTQNLWESLSVSSGQNVDSLMSNWIKKTGYPSIFVQNEKFDNINQVMTISLHQKRFLSSGDLTEDEDTVVWVIPIGVRTKNGLSRHLLSTRNGEISFPFQGKETDFYKLNADVTGFYRVCYNLEQLEALSSALAKSLNSFSIEDRIGILSDVFSYALSGEVSTTGALEIAVGFKDEESFMCYQIDLEFWKSFRRE